MREKVIKLIQEFLKVNTRIFFNENEFQMELAVFIKERMCKNVDDAVFLEYRALIPSCNINGTPKAAEFDHINIDIVVKCGNQYMPIELKYKTKAANTGLYTFGVVNKNEELNLTTDAAQNNSCYDYWRDVKRIEAIKEKYPDTVKGVAVILTNEPWYWIPRDNVSKNTQYYNLHIRNGREFNANQRLEWNVTYNSDEELRKNKGGRANSIILKNPYTIKWNGEFQISNITFNYLMLPIR